MDIVITTGTNAKAHRVTRIRVEISDRDLATVKGDPDEFMKIILRSRESAGTRLSALSLLAHRIEAKVGKK